MINIVISMWQSSIPLQILFLCVLKKFRRGMSPRNLFSSKSSFGKTRESERQRPFDGRAGRVLSFLEQRKRGVEMGGRGGDERRQLRNEVLQNCHINFESIKRNGYIFDIIALLALYYIT